MSSIDMSKTYILSPDVVAREIEGELIIIPITSGVGDLEESIYTLNETGKVLWGKLDGTKTLGQIAGELMSEYDAPRREIEKDVVGLIEELAKRNIAVEKT